MPVLAGAHRVINVSHILTLGFLFAPFASQVIVQKNVVIKCEQYYQKAHHPEKDRQRFSKAVACSISFSTCAATDKATSGLKSRPVILFCTRLYTNSARSFRTSWAPPSRPSSFWMNKHEVLLIWFHLPLKISFSSALSFRVGPWGCAAALADSAARAGDISVSADTLLTEMILQP